MSTSRLLEAAASERRSWVPSSHWADYLALFPYDDSVTRFTVSGAQLKHAFAGFMRPENRNGEGEYYQVNRGVKAVYDLVKHELVSLALNGVPVDDSSHYSICLQGYHYKNSIVGLQLTNEELAQLEKPRLLATSGRDGRRGVPAQPPEHPVGG